MYYVERTNDGYIRRVERLAEKLSRRDMVITSAKRVMGFDWDYEVPVRGEGVYWLVGLTEAEFQRLNRRAPVLEEEVMRDINELNWDMVPGGKTPHREAMVKLYWAELTEAERAAARLEVCSDEWTGCRYGQAANRRGKAVKVGGGGRNKGSKVDPYQVWLVWA